MNDCKLVQVLGFERLRSTLIVPDVVTGFVPPNERLEFGVANVMEVTVPEPLVPEIQVPEIEKHPLERFIPVFDVEVAVANILKPSMVVVPVL